ncbi:phosphatidylglycerol lysyltransferase domain-containing protein, partial [Acetobacter pomorum]
AALAEKKNRKIQKSPDAPAAPAPAQRRPSQVVRESEAAFSVAVATGTVSFCGVMLICLVMLDPVPKFAMVPESLLTMARVGGNYVLSLMGVVLISLAIGLSQRVTLAWRGALYLLLTAAVLTFLRGNTFFVPVMLGLSALFIAPFRSCYYRHARLLSEPLSTGTLLSLLLLFGCVIALATRHDTSGSWWQMMLATQARGSVRWTIALSVGLALIVVARLMWPGRIAVREWDEDAYTHYKNLDHALPDIQAFHPQGYVTGEAGEAILPLYRRDAYLVALGDPAGEETDSISAIWKLRDLALQEGLKPVFWQVGHDFLRIYDDIGLSVWALNDGSGFNFCYPADDIGQASRFVKKYKGGAGNLVPSDFS